MNVPEAFEHWMEVETSYALSKFSPADQYPYLVEGVTRGSFSFQSSALGYMRRACTIAEVLEEVPEVSGLRLVQMLGKAAHNLVALDATAKSYNSDMRSQIAAGFDTIHRLAQQVAPDVAYSSNIIDAATIRRRSLFSVLQTLQDEQNWPAFHGLLGLEMQLAADQFVSAAENYGWPKPGFSSGNVEPWTAPQH